MPFAAAVPAIISGVSALAGLFGGKGKQTTESKFDRTTTPQYDPLAQSFRDFLIKSYQGGLNETPEFEQAYKTLGLQTIADNARRTYGSMDDILTSRGLGRTSAGAGSLRDVLYGAGRSSADFLNKSMLDMDQYRQGKLASASSFLSSLPFGQRETGTTTGVASTPGGGLAGAITGGAQGLAGVLGQWYANNSLANMLKGIKAN